MKKIVSRMIDISVPMNEHTPIYEGNPPFSVSWAMSISSGDQVNLSELHEGVHTGTHIDAPLHFLERGSSIDRVPLRHFFCNVQVVRTKRGTITPSVLEKVKPMRTEGILFRTSNSGLYGKPFTRDFVFIEGDTARMLARARVPIVGIDYLSVERFGSKEAPAHHILLGAGIPILEGINLGGVRPGRYTLAVFPLRLEGREAAPARAVLFDPPLASVIDVR